MEKLDLLLWSDDAVAAARDLDVRAQPGLISAQVSVAARLPKATLLMGRGEQLAGFVALWVDSVDVWPSIVDQAPSDAYLVTESVLQPVSGTRDLLLRRTMDELPLYADSADISSCPVRADRADRARL